MGWRAMRAQRIAAYEQRFGRPYDPTDDLPDYDCATCHDTGRYLRNGLLTPCPCGIGQEWPAWDPAAARIPISLRPRYTVWRPDEAAWDEVQSWLSTWRPETPFLTLMGKPGAGKSQMACCLLAQIHEERHERVAFWGVVEILDRLKATFSERVEDGDMDPTGRVMSEMAGQQVLCIDDVGSSRPTEWAEERLYAIVNARMEAERPTIITCNPSGPGWDGLHARLNTRIMIGRLITLTGPDRRIRR